ncbi:hypothetical protein JMJ35_009587 [Cladonia borealis]|uniref:Uncharacterized protein n=1 Tax=Cladonia borealis TaxID=184061 RepID=A0AA39QTZ3_9LECA|nr:hypothetical protein JMJ35_009587 [Cladonia borealis]
MAFGALKSQWQHPIGFLEVLLILRGDVIQTAVAQLSGGPFHFTPVPFSFGWVSYSFSALLSAIGDGRFCEEKYKSVRKDGKPRPAPTDLKRNKDKLDGEIRFTPPCPKMDLMWYTGIFVMVVQWAVAAVAGIIEKDWLIMTITISGTFLSLAGGALTQWKQEKWSCRRLSEPKTVILTRGNGHRHLMILHSLGAGPDLEDLATARASAHWSTFPLLFILAISWGVILLLVGNLYADTWYLVAVGGLGMAQNLFAAGHHRDASAYGIYLENPDNILPDPPAKDEYGKEISNKEFQVLKKTEKRMSEKYGIHGVGICLLPIFFPNGLRPAEIEWRDQQLENYQESDRKETNTKKDCRNEEQNSPRASKSNAVQKDSYVGNAGVEGDRHSQEKDSRSSESSKTYIKTLILGLASPIEGQDVKATVVG